ncbi:MAG: hypothetical protein KGM18_00135 [Sphingomonadales bacterium]|nr:hypothetical protein [Sphingomonadales bacterium]
MRTSSSCLALAISLLALSEPAHAADHNRHHARPNEARVTEQSRQNDELRQELAELRAEVSSLKQALESEHATQVATNTEVQTLNSEIAAAPATAREQARTEVASAIEKEHHRDAIGYKGIRLQPGGFLEFAGIYRQHYQGNDIASSYAIPFANNRAAHTSEGRFTARQSRLSLLAQGKASDNVTLSMYGEFDFLGGAQTANSNESNSYNPRIRNIYGTVDWNQGGHGWHLLAGQNWSLLTLSNKGISPRNEQMPPQIDAQYIPGFNWARQPQLRLTGDFLDHRLWIAVSAENPATTFGGAAPSTVTNLAPAGSGFDAANSLSLNHMPDFVGKIAYEGMLGGRSVHLEGFALSRTFTAHLNGAANVNKGGYGFGGGVILQAVPKLIDLQISGMVGRGIGRYGSAQLPDVAFAADGSIHPIHEYMLLGGATLHATKKLDLYLFAGEEVERSERLGTYGIGLTSANNSGCSFEAGTCAGNTRRVAQITGGLWQKIYNGSFGRAQVGVQYSHTERDLFEGIGGAPTASQNMGFLSLRYYPF